jgi:predicted permease
MPDGDTASGAWDRPLTVVRFRADVPPEDTLRQATEVAHAADSSTTGQVAVRKPLAEWTGDGYEGRVMTMFASGVGLVFLSLCVNVSGLLLARFNQRRRQFAVCAALGASRRRLVTQALTESFVLSATGAAAGVWLAHGLLVTARTLLPPELQPYRPLEVDARLALAAAAAAMVATTLTGLLPALLATRVNVRASLGSVERGATEGKGARLLARSFVVAEIALACMLVIPTLLLIRSFLNLSAIDRGLDPRGLSAVFVDFSNSLAPGRDRRLPIVAAATDALNSLPDVDGVAWSVGIPTVEDEVLSGNWWPDMRWGAPVPLTARGISVGGDFLKVYGIPLTRGRTFEPADGPDAVIVDERIANMLWPGLNPVGHSFMVAERYRYPDRRALRVIGVARDVHRQMPVRGRDLPTVYSRFEPGGLYASVTLKCRVTCPSEAVIRHGLIALSPGLRVNRVLTLEESFAVDLAAPRMTTTVAIIFAAIAVVTAAGGLFSVLSHAVGRRRREFGIRSALGGSARAIGTLVLRDAIVTTVLGLAIGSIAAWYLTRALAAVQFGVTISDPVSWALVLGVMAVVTLAASWRPMRNAMRVDVALLIRDE